MFLFMSGHETENAPGAVGQPLFATTHWSVILTAGRQDAPQSAAALEELCRAYWYPLYVFVHRKGHSPKDAEDLTQAFFERLIKRDISTHNRAMFSPDGDTLVNLSQEGRVELWHAPTLAELESEPGLSPLVTKLQKTGNSRPRSL